MNRRRLLQVGAALGSAAFAGCVDGVREHFTGSVQGVVPLEIHSESDSTMNLHIEAHDRETDQLIYEEGVTVGAQQSAYPSHLRGVDQFLRVARIDSDDQSELEVKQTAVTADARVVLVHVYDDEYEIEVVYGEDGDRETIDDPEDAEAIEGDNATGASAAGVDS